MAEIEGSKLDLPTFSSWDVIKLFLQVGAIVWGAATLKNDVGGLTRDLEKQTATIQQMTGAVNALTIQNSVFEVRISNLEKMK